MQPDRAKRYVDKLFEQPFLNIFFSHRDELQRGLGLVERTNTLWTPIPADSYHHRETDGREYIFHPGVLLSAEGLDRYARDEQLIPPVSQDVSRLAGTFVSLFHDESDLVRELHREGHAHLAIYQALRYAHGADIPTLRRSLPVVNIPGSEISFVNWEHAHGMHEARDGDRWIPITSETYSTRARELMRNPY